MFARANAIKDKRIAASALSEIFELDEKELYEKLTKKKASEITVAKKVGKEKIEKLSALALDGIYYARDNVR